MLQYMKNRIWDWILCTGISLGLVYPVFAGFVLKDALSPDIFGVCVLLLAEQLFLTLVSRNRKLTAAGIIIGICLLAAFVLFSRRGNPFLHESSMSLAITLFITVLTGLLVFLAARTRPGTAVLFLLGFLVIAGSRFLRFPVKNWSFLLFLFCVFLMFLYRNYALTIRQVQTGKVRVHRYMMQSILICLIGLGISGGIFAGIVRPMNPPTRQLKLITRLERMDLLKVVGVSTTKTVLNPDMAADSRTDSSASGNKKKSTNAGNRRNQEKQSDSRKNSTRSSGARSNTDRDQNRTQASRQMHYDIHQVRIPWIPILIAAVIAAAFIGRMLHRRHWEHRIQNLSNEDGVVNYYRYFLFGLSRCGYRKPENHTLLEYARNMEHEMQAFSDGDDTFSELTDIYCRTVYGRQPVSDREYQMFVRFYRNFRRNLRRETGFFRFLVKYFFRSTL